MQKFDQKKFWGYLPGAIKFSITLGVLLFSLIFLVSLITMGSYGLIRLLNFPEAMSDVAFGKMVIVLWLLWQVINVAVNYLMKLAELSKFTGEEMALSFSPTVLQKFRGGKHGSANRSTQS